MAKKSQTWWEEFEAQYEAGGLFMLIVHPFLTGRLVEQWLEATLKERDVWFAPLGEIKDHVSALTVAGTYTPRIEQLPYFAGPVS